MPWGHRRDTEFGMRGTHGDTASDWGRWEHSAKGKGGDTERVWGEGDTEGTLPDTAVGTQCHTIGRWGHGDVGTPPEFGVTVLREHRWELGSQCCGDTDGNWGHSAVGTLTGIGVTVLWGHRWELGSQYCGDTDGNWGHSAMGTLTGIGVTVLRGH